MSASESADLSLLVRRARAGKGEWDDIITATVSRLETLTRRALRSYPRVRRWEQTDDVFQAAVIRLRRSLSEVRPESASQYLGLAATQIRRTLLDLVRHYYGQQGLGTRHHSDCEAPVRAGDAGFQNEPETLTEWASFHEAVATLPDDERKVFELTWYSGLQQRDIAELQGVSLSTVKRRWHKARLLLASGQQLPST